MLWDKINSFKSMTSIIFYYLFLYSFFTTVFMYQFIYSVNCDKNFINP